MRRLLLLLACWLLIAPLSGLAQSRYPAASDTGENRTALIIGNASYKDSPLANPVNDARAVAKALGNAGFQVKVLTNLTQSQMRRAIREFGDELHARQGVGLFYFAGHGVQISNRNFLIPVGSDIQREYEVEDQAVDAGAILSMMHSAKARVNIVILDACRNNPFIRDLRTTVNGLAPMQAPTGTLVAFSTAPGQTAIDGTGQYGLYTEHLVDNLTVPGLKIEDVFKNVRVSVQRASSGKQVPWENTSLTGDFYFMIPSIAAAAAIESPSRAALTTAAASQDDINRAVQAALRRREEEQVARQAEIERAVMAALRKREEELASTQAARAERDAAQSAIERLNKELAELRAAREAEKVQPERVAAVREAAPQSSTSSQGGARVPAQPSTRPPEQVALAAPASRTQPAVSVGGRAEQPDVRVGDRWKYQVTDLSTDLKSTVIMEVATVTANRIYTRSARFEVASLDVNLTAAAGTVDVWDRDWNQLRAGNIEYTTPYPSFQFPLESGKSWSGSLQFATSQGTMRQQLTARVEGWERVTVPAGTYDAVKITLRGHFNTAGIGHYNMLPRGTVNNVVWYAPSVRQIVKKEINLNDTSSSRLGAQAERWELVELRAAGESEGAQPQPLRATVPSQPSTRAPEQFALAAPASRTQPAVSVGGRAEQPDVRVGDRWKYQVTDTSTNLKSTVVVEVATVTGNRIYTRSARYETASLDVDLTAAAGTVDVWDRDWNQLRAGNVEYATPYPSFQFPLESGKNWSGNPQWPTSHGTLRQQLTARVEGWERVTVPAGTYDAVKITLRGHFNTSGVGHYSNLPRGTVDNVVWYAPAVRQFVKKEINHNDSSSNRSGQQSERWELVEHKSN